MRRRWRSTKAKLEYLEIPKAACSSIKSALLHTDGLAMKDGGHMHANRHWRERPEWQPLLCFTFVRHPLDRLRSAYYDKLQTGDAAAMGGSCPLHTTATFGAWVDWVTSQPAERCDKHWMPQAFLLERYAREGRPKPTLIGRVETITEQWAQLQRTYPLAPLPHFRRSRPFKKAVYTKKAIAKATQFYRPDFDAFGYTPLPKKITQKCVQRHPV